MFQYFFHSAHAAQYAATFGQKKFKAIFSLATYGSYNTIPLQICLAVGKKQRKLFYF